MKLSEKILRLRKARGMSQEELAGELNVSRQAVSRWESGSALPDAANLLQLSRLFGVTADYLLDDAHGPQAGPASTAAPTVPTSLLSRWRQWLGALLLSVGLAGNFMIYLCSRFIPVMVPWAQRQADGSIRYTWETGHTDYNYRYFIQDRNLEGLVMVLCLLAVAGLALILVRRFRRPTFSNP